jgi:hypothetical protein
LPVTRLIKLDILKAVRTLLIGTTGGEFSVSADGTDAAVTPTNGNY